MKTILSTLALTGCMLAAFAQEPGWLHKDLKSDSIFGISTEKAYKELLKGKKSRPVIVGVVDAGADYKHEDLKNVMYINKKEIAGNGKDDDKNGYADDVYGWNFLGSAKGSVTYDNMELARLVRKDPASPLKDTLDKKIAEASNIVNGTKGFQSALAGVVSKIGSATPDSIAFAKFQPASDLEARVKAVVLNIMSQGESYEDIRKDIDGSIKHYEQELKYSLNPDYNSRDTVGDDPNNMNERYYGNAEVDAFDCDHGTHVAGIIAAQRGNGLGIDGIADNVQIMAVRAVPNGDERDKDIANAIRYAVDNGAKVINMSFGKGYSPNKDVVDNAFKYAVSKDVLLVHAAGNDAKNLDEEKNYPTVNYLDGGSAETHWIEVGASSFKNDETLPATFSNYGAKTVDVFAPGVAIYSTVPGSKYENHQGTSMAAPVVAGLAALIREYYPKLTASQVKDIIVSSVEKVSQPVIIPGKKDSSPVPFTQLCKSGGVVNAYKALQMAAAYKAKK
ncbi:S8 family peptidase [Pedobacter sp. JY14-1]|uniref:S8 family peptidase n=1 Tax=Pedobacter sp. JY14-1 TaxID=3034151 RepID=UPI0023E15862|nr:S8 family peptidase [Pedobacter sp. JY14-1]